MNDKDIIFNKAFPLTPLSEQEYESCKENFFRTYQEYLDHYLSRLNNEK